jgi:hypothetical protein
MLEDYDGCWDEHPDCERREEKWAAVEEVISLLPFLKPSPRWCPIGVSSKNTDLFMHDKVWVYVKQMLRKEEAAGKALEKALFDATAARDAAKSQRDHVRQRIEVSQCETLQKRTRACSQTPAF